MVRSHPGSPTKTSTWPKLLRSISVFGQPSGQQALRSPRSAPTEITDNGVKISAIGWRKCMRAVPTVRSSPLPASISILSRIHGAHSIALASLPPALPSPRPWPTQISSGSEDHWRGRSICLQPSPSMKSDRRFHDLARAEDLVRLGESKVAKQQQLIANLKGPPLARLRLHFPS
jgi:hypothetical protein